MAEDKRQGWLAELNVGDRVGYGHYAYGRELAYIGRILNITPTGRITVGRAVGNASRVFDPMGRQTARGDYRLIPLDEAFETCRKNAAYRALQEALDALATLGRRLDANIAPERADEIRNQVERAMGLLAANIRTN